MTRPERDYDEILSRVLHSTLDPIEPAGDGLSKIQRRIAEPWLQRQWSLLRNELTALGWLIFVRSEPFLNRARSRLAAFAVRSSRRLRSAAAVLRAAVTRTGSGRHQHAAGNDGPASVLRKWWLGPTVTWLRPALAVGGAVVIVVVGGFTLSNLHATLSPQAASNSGPYAVGSSHGGARNDQGGYGGGHSSSQSAPARGAGTSQAGKETTKPQSGRNATAPHSSCSPAPPPSGTPSPSATPTPSPTPSSTVSATPSPTGSPTSGAPAPPPASPGSQGPGTGPSCAPHPGNGPA